MKTKQRGEAPPSEAIARVFARQKANQAHVRRTTAAERITKLKRLRDVLVARRPAIYRALAADFQKAPTETDLTDVMPVLIEIQHAVQHLKRWMEPKKIATPLVFAGTKGKIHYEPKGTVLIISPWNFPVNLTLGPLVAAVAAGNCAMLKPSELTPHTARVMAELVQTVFEENEVALFEGDHRVAQELLTYPFDHIFFTGSPRVGQIIMKAAAEHLASVTLELGGKSPTIVDETADLPSAARKIALGKFANSGQICIAPDYLFVHARMHDALVTALQHTIGDFYGASEAMRAATPDYARLINDEHWERVRGLVDAAVRDGAHVAAGAQADVQTRYIAPTLLTDVPLNTPIMEEEIFGPVLPILKYTDLDDVVTFINSKPAPLTMYVFSNDVRTIDAVMQRTTAGSTLINDTLIHFIDPELPFGGTGASGMGKAHGHAGFLAFSNERPVLAQRLKNTPVQLLSPPYTGRVSRLRDLFFKYLRL